MNRKVQPTIVLLVKDEPIDQRTQRELLTAYISDLVLVNKSGDP